MRGCRDIQKSAPSITLLDDGLRGAPGLYEVVAKTGEPATRPVTVRRGMCLIRQLRAAEAIRVSLSLAATSSTRAESSVRKHTSGCDNCCSACALTKRPSWLRLENPLRKAAQSHASGAVLGLRDLSGYLQRGTSTHFSSWVSHDSRSG